MHIRDRIAVEVDAEKLVDPRHVTTFPGLVGKRTFDILMRDDTLDQPLLIPVGVPHVPYPLLKFVRSILVEVE